MKKGFTILMVGLLFLGGVAFEANADPLDKLGRGSINVLTGVLEVPKTIFQDSVDKNPLFGGTFGVLHGGANALFRVGAGAIDILTFPFAPYDVHIVPEYVF